MIVKRLDSGYWLVRWSWNRFVQWPVGTRPRAEHAFGWVTPAMLDEAEACVEVNA